MATMILGSSSSFLLYSPSVAGKSLSPARSKTTTKAAAAALEAAATAVTHPAPAAPQSIPGGDLLCLDFDELAEVLQGSGRAKMVWAALAAGVNPFSEGAAEFLTDKTARVLKDNVQGLLSQVLLYTVVQSALGSFTAVYS